jgi:Tol biopolymer transport system component
MGMWRVAASAAALALALPACGGDDQASSQETMVMWRATAGTERNPSARYDIVAIDATTGQRQVLTAHLGRQAQPLLFDRPTWSPDGRRIAFTVELDGDSAAPYRTDIYVMDRDGSDVRRLTHSERALFPVWSPDRRTIAFAKRASSRPRSFRELVSATIWAVRTDGSDERQLVPSSGITADIPGAWSPNGHVLAFTRRMYLNRELDFESRTAIYVVAADGSGVRRFIDQASEPVWSPDGRLIAYVSDRDRNGKLTYGDRTSFANELYVTNADGSEPKRLTTTRDLNERTPAWSPDGTRIAYTRGKQVGNAEATSVLIIEADGECPTEIAADDPNGDWYANAVWRPTEARSRFKPTCT